jgi:LacI family transcriptional regulator
LATMEDVARAANVSMSTVSHVLNGTRKVSPDKVSAVKEAMQKIGYLPNTLARTLAGSASRTIGVAISGLTNHYFSETVRAIEAACAKHGLMMFFADTHDDPRHELSVVQALHQRRVDGILLAPTADPEFQTLEYLRANKIPAVLVDRFMSCEFDQVGVENELSSMQLVSHLIEHGHRRIGLISGTPGLSTTDERIEGYRAALEKAGLEFDEALVRCGESNIDPARFATCDLLALDSPPTAIMAANNLMTIGVMHALRDKNIEVPTEMALVGFDDFDWADYFSPRLTVMAQPLEDLGARAVALLMRRIKKPDENRQIVRLAPTCRIRNSCGCC